MDVSGYLKAIDAADAVAFDIFDTLLVRPFFHPHDLFGFLEAESGLEGFAEARIRAEREARRTDPETDIDGIYRSIDPKYLALKDAEIGSEISFSRADPDMVEVFGYASEKGKNIVLVSDMYLPSDILERMVSKNGFSGHSKIYVSTETKVSKRSGLMYDTVLGDLGLPPSKVLMIGDNRHADCDSAISKGLKAMRWIPMKERYAASHRHEMRFLKRYPGYESSVIVAMDMLGWVEHPDETYWHMVSRRFGGPMNIMFAKFVMDNSEDMDKLVFFSRDGYMPMKVYEALGGKKPFVYLHTSRMIAKVFGRRDLSDRDTVLSLMAYLRDSGRYRDIEVPGKSEYRRFAEENREVLERIMAEGHARYDNYLKRTVGDAGKIMLVDATTMKFTSQGDVERYLDHVDVTGCYYAVTAEGKKKHLAYCDRSRQHLCSSYVNLAEYFLGSGERPLLDIGDDGRPVFEEDVPNDETIRIRAFPQIYDGILDCTGSYSEMFGDRIPSVSGKVMDGWMDVLMAEESGNDPNTLSGIKWAVNTQHSIYKHLILRLSDIPGVLIMKIGEVLYSHRKR